MGIKTRITDSKCVVCGQFGKVRAIEFEDDKTPYTRYITLCKKCRLNLTMLLNDEFWEED